jgi:hypothetical protein
MEAGISDHVWSLNEITVLANYTDCPNIETGVKGKE